MTPRAIPNRDATVADIARAAKVSKATAARALGDYGPVSDAVRDRVLAAAAELNYRPNALAKSMNTGKSNTIGVVIGDIENPFFGQAMRGISDVAKEAGFDVILSNSDEDVEAERAAVDLLLDKRVDGLIVAPASSIETGHLRAVHASGRPIVLLDRRADDTELDSITVDNRGAAGSVARTLLAAGHRRIAFISTLEAPSQYASGDRLSMSTVRDRVHGIVEALSAAEIADPERHIRLDARRLGIGILVRSLVSGDEPATAIIGSDSLVALGILRELRALGLEVPRDISVVAFDNPDWTSITTPPLSVVAQPIYELGAAAARAVIARVERRAGADGSVVFPTEFIPRESIAAPALASPVR